MDNYYKNIKKQMQRNSIFYAVTVSIIFIFLVIMLHGIFILGENVLISIFGFVMFSIMFMVSMFFFFKVLGIWKSGADD